ncbi:MAG TPA: hypothetical protein DCQ76_05480 [Ruminococcaceae bacterium]|nr:hypothetical protein [Oscillospiraceae bacterium]
MRFYSRCIYYKFLAFSRMIFYNENNLKQGGIKMSKINYNGPDVFKPLSPWAYFGLSILFSLPVVGFIFLIIFSVSDANVNRRNFARSYWCVYIIIAVAAVIMIASGVTIGSLENVLSAVRPIA